MPFFTLFSFLPVFTPTKHTLNHFLVDYKVIQMGLILSPIVFQRCLSKSTRLFQEWICIHCPHCLEDLSFFVVTPFISVQLRMFAVKCFYNKDLTSSSSNTNLIIQKHRMEQCNKRDDRLSNIQLLYLSGLIWG